MAETIAQTIYNVNVSRYLSLAGVVMLIYDHCLTFSDEVEFIWKAEWKIPKVLFLFLRYIVPIALLVNIVYMTGITGDKSDKHCQIWFGVSVFIGIVCVYVANFLALLHLWNISDRNRFLVIASLLVYIGAFIANLITTALAVSYLLGHTTYSPIVGICGLNSKKGLPGVWTPGIALDVIIIPTVIYNALEKPRDARTELTTQIFRDGLLFFALLLVLRLTNLLLAIYAPISLIFLGVYFIWACTTMTITRMMLRLRKLQVKRNTKYTREDIEMDVKEPFWTRDVAPSRLSHHKQYSFP